MSSAPPPIPMTKPFRQIGFISTLQSRRAPWWMFLFADTVRAESPPNIFDPASTPAHSIFSLSMLVFSVTATIFLIVDALLLYALLRFRHRSEDPYREPAQIYGSNQIELASDR